MLLCSTALALLAGYTPWALDPVAPSRAQRLEGTTVEKILRRYDPDPRSLEDLVDELVRLGPGLIPTWMGWLAGEGVDTVFLTGDEFRAEEWMVRPEQAYDLALRTLARLPAEDVVTFMERRARGERPEVTRVLTTFAVLEVLGSARGLDLYWTLVEQLGQDVFALRRVRQCADAALAAILARDSMAWPLVARRLRKPVPAEAELLTEAFRRAGRPAAQPLLVDLLALSSTSSERLDVLEGMAVLERRFPWRFDGEAVRALQASWLGLTQEDRIEAAELLGRSEDPEALDPLLDLLESQDASDRRAAEAALRELAGLSHGRDLQAWRRWHERELRWAHDSEALFLRLEGQPAEVAAALEELARHPLYRRSIALRVGASLAYQEPATLGLSLDFLAALGSRAALPALVEIVGQLQDEALIVRARAALETLGGEPFQDGAAYRRRVLGE